MASNSDHTIDFGGLTQYLTPHLTFPKAGKLQMTTENSVKKNMSTTLVRAVLGNKGKVAPMKKYIF